VLAVNPRWDDSPITTRRHFFLANITIALILNGNHGQDPEVR